MPISAPKIPDGLPELMRGLAKSVIKENPENLYLHAAEYFENLIRERDGTLERGYQGFNAYQVYADYKEKTREKLGLAPGKQSSVSDEGDGDADDTGSGESTSKTRGRTRRRRTRKPSSAEKENPVTEVQSGAVRRDGDIEPVPRRKSSELSEEAAPVSVVEEEVVKVHYNPPEAQPTARVISAQSVEAEQAVLTVLDDEQMLDSDGVSKETEEDEPLESVEDIGTAPSTADVTETEASVVVDSVPLQDLETCFMHANVDHLLEKHTEEGAVEDLKIADADAKDETQQELPPQGGQDVKESAIADDLDAKSTIKQEDGESKEDGAEEAEKEGSDEVGVMQMDGGRAEKIDISNDGVIAEPSVGDQQTTDHPVNTEAPENRPQSAGKAEENVLSSSDENVADGAVGNTQQDDHATPVEDEQKDLNIEGKKINTDEATDIAASDAMVSQTDPTPVAEPTNKISSRFGEDDEEDQALDENGTDEVDDSKEKMGEEVAPEMSSKHDSQADTLPDNDLSSNVKKSEAKAETPVSSVPQNLPEALSRSHSKEEKSEAKIESTESDEKLTAESPIAADEMPDGNTAKPSDNLEKSEIEKEIVSPDDAVAEVPPSTESLGVAGEQSDIKEGIQNDSQENIGDPVENVIEKNDDVKGKVALEESNSLNDAIPNAQEAEADKAETQNSDPLSTNNEVPVSNFSIELAGDDSNMKTASGESNIEPANASFNPEPASEESVDADKADDQISSAMVVAQDSNESKTAEPIRKESLEKENVPMASEVEEQPKSEAKASTDEPTENPLLEEVESADEPKAEQVTTDNRANDESTVDSTNAGIVAKMDDGNSDQKSPPDEDNTKEEQKGQIQSSDSTDTAGTVANNVVNEPSETEIPSQPTPPDQSVTEGSSTNVKEELKEQPPAIGTAAEVEQKGNITDVKDESEIPAALNIGNSDEQKPAELNDQTANTANTEEKKDIETPQPASVDVSMPATTSEIEDTKTDLINQETHAHQQQSGDTPTVGEKISSQEVVDDPPGPSLEEVIEEPCIKRQVSPSNSTRPEPVEEIVEKKEDQELEEIKKVDLSQLSKDSAEALFYSLKKSALENQEEKDGSVGAASNSQDSATAAKEDDDDKDVVVAEEPPVQATTDDGTKRTFTDDFLDEVPITEADPVPKVASSDGGAEENEPEALEAQTSLEASEKDDAFNPMVMVSMRSKQFQDQLHEREARLANEGEGVSPENLTAKRPLMRRCMTEMADLQRFDDTAQEDETTDGTSYVEDEDQFDGYYIGHIKNKILASSVSVADSDCFDPTRSPQEPANDETEVRTALETIASTDTESTIASQATIQQAGSKRSYLRKHSQNTSSNIPYASFGNAAIDQSLDEFIEREEQNKQDEAFAEAATKIQRSYRTHKKRLLRDYHSTMRTFTEDQSAESGEEYNNSAANVIQIKLDQKRDPTTDSSGLGTVADGGEESDSNNASLHVPLGTGGRRPMYSLNIDDYDTVARRMTLTRGVAMQRNSTPDDDSGKSTNASTDRKPSLADGDGKVVAPAQPVAEILEDSPVSVPEAEQSRSEEREPDNDNGGVDNNSQSQPTPDEPRPQHRELSTAVPKPIRSQTKVLSSHRVAPVDVQNLLLIARQRTMPVQIDSSVIRVLPKHMRKRISSAGMMSDGKRK